MADLKLTVEVDVDSIEQAQYIQRALQDPEIRAFAITMGILDGLEAEERAKVLRCVSILLDIK